MKLKKDFITNSSSTSFVLSKVKGEKIGKCKITIEVDFDKLSCQIFKSKEEIEEEFGDWSMIDRVMPELEKGKEIVQIRVYSDSDEPIEQFLCYNGIKDSMFENTNIKVISGEGGY